MRSISILTATTLAALLLAGCQAPLNNLRAKRFGDGTPPPTVPHAQPRAMALALQANEDGNSLAPASLRSANELLTRQGRIDSQVLTLTPFNERGAALAPRLAKALTRSGAKEPRIAPMPADAQRLQQAQAGGWDLELQSEALALDIDRCKIAQPDDWGIHPFYGVGALGCANRANIARMASDPRDLERPRTLDPTEGRTAASAVGRYQGGEVRDLIDIDFEE